MKIVISCVVGMVLLVPLTLLPVSWAQRAATTKRPVSIQIEVSVIKQFEQRLFFKTYPLDELEQRVQRIEKQIFGAAVQGAIQERLRHLEDLFAEIAKAESLHVPSKAKELESQSIGAKNNTSNGAISSNRKQGPTGSLNKSGPNESEFAGQRGKIAVQAAREQEIRDLLLEGVSLWRAKKGPGAIEKFKQVLRLDPRNAEAHFSMGIIEESAEHLPEALASYQQAASSCPNNAEYQSAMAAIANKLSAKKQATPQEQALSQLSEDAATAYRRGEYISALDLYRQLDEKAPNQALVKYNIGTIYLVLSDYKTAITYYKQAHKLAPQNARYKDSYLALTKGIHKAEQTETKKDNAKQDAMSNYGLTGKSSKSGVKVIAIASASRAERAGLQVGDRIRAVEGREVSQTKQINEIFSQKQPQDSVQILIERDGKLALFNL